MNPSNASGRTHILVALILATGIATRGYFASNAGANVG
jgi:hypothetical protein